MKVFFDTEFTGLHMNTTLISIGLVSEDRRMFYAELTDYDSNQCDKWIAENVIKHLNCEKPSNEKVYIPNYHIGNREQICECLENWFRQFDSVELVSDVCHYDMVLLINLFGAAFDLPKNVSPCCHDINQDIAKYLRVTDREAFDKSREDILYNKYKENAVSGDKHNSLYDAKVIRELYQIVNNVNFDNN